MERRSGGLGRGWPPGRRWRWARVPAVAAGLLLTERALVAAVGAPVAQMRALRSLGQGPVDPMAPLLAALALLTEALVGYVLVVLILRSLCALPESVGRLASRAALVTSPVVVRRLLDLLVGGTLLVQATVAAMPEPPPGPRASAVHMTQTASRTLSGAFDRAASRSGPPVTVTEPVPARPSPPVSGATAALAGGRAVQNGARAHRGGGRHPVGHRRRPARAHPAVVGHEDLGFCFSSVQALIASPMLMLQPRHRGRALTIRRWLASSER